MRGDKIGPIIPFDSCLINLLVFFFISSLVRQDSQQKPWNQLSFKKLSAILEIKY